MARYIFSDSYAATVLPIIREIHREILARKPPDAAISNRAIARPSRHAESRQCTAAVGRRCRLRPCSIGARRRDLQSPRRLRLNTVELRMIGFVRLKFLKRGIGGSSARHCLQPRGL
jgi:hypothetical protein